MYRNKRYENETRGGALRQNVNIAFKWKPFKKINILTTLQFFKNKHVWSDILLKNIIIHEEQAHSNS